MWTADLHYRGCSATRTPRKERMDKSPRIAAQTGAAINNPPAAGTPPPLQSRWGFAVSSGILGWILDAFTFFILIFVVDALAANFHVAKAAIVWSITITLATRPIGALILGSMADRFGRRRPLIACVLFFSVFTALTPFAPNYTVFILYRALYGIGMGGYWGIGASLVMESSPSRLRGLFSGIMQAGYSLGYLLAAVAVRTIEPRFRRNLQKGREIRRRASEKFCARPCITRKISPISSY